MVKRLMIVGAALVSVVGIPRPAAADWLLTGFFGPIMNVSTSAQEGIAEAENFDSSTGFGVNLASAFPSRANLGFELDWGWYGGGLEVSDVYGTAFASRLMSLSTNFFYSPAIPRVRPYFAVGPNFGYRSDHDSAAVDTDSGWAVGINVGGGVMAFANERFAGRVDLRYYRNFGDFYSIGADEVNRTGWNNLQFFRIFFGGTVVLN